MVGKKKKKEEGKNQLEQSVKKPWIKLWWGGCMSLKYFPCGWKICGGLTQEIVWCTGRKELGHLLPEPAGSG